MRGLSWVGGWVVVVGGAGGLVGRKPEKLIFWVSVCFCYR